MKHLTTFLTTLAVVLYLGAVPALAQHGHGGGHGMGAAMGGGHERGEGSTMRETGDMSTHGSKTADQLLARNSKLSSRLQRLLPPGTNVQQAARGFKNLGQFVAAVHVSHNLGIPFAELRSRILSGESLGKAIHELKPNVRAKDEARRADREAKEDLRESS